MDITLVTLPNSEIRKDGLAYQMTAGVVVENIESSSGNDQGLLFRVIQQLESDHPFFPGQSDFKLFSVVLKGFNTNSATGVAIFQTTKFDAVSSYIIRFSGFASATETNLIPGLRIPIKVGWKGKAVSVPAPPEPGGDPATSSKTVTPTVAPDLVNMRFFLPVLAVSVSGLVYGNPPTGYQEGVAYVSDGPWPSSSIAALIRPKPRGYWMLQKYETAISKFKGYYTYDALAGTRVFADWSETGVLVNRQTGRHVEVSDEAVAAMNALPYDYGYIYPTGADQEKVGIVRIGGNPILSFSDIFGF